MLQATRVVSSAVPFLPLLLSLSLGCQPAHAAAPPPSSSSASSAQQGSATQSPAPFASPPVLAGAPDVATLVAKVNPSVVNIVAMHDVKTRRSPFPFDFFDPFGGAMPQRGSPGPRGGGGEGVTRQRALGTGFIIDGSGHVATNAHVVEDANRVRVRLADDRELDAKVVGRDTRLDLAVLELQGIKNVNELPVAALGSSEKLRVGEYVVAIGNPFGLGHTVTMGIVSAKGRSIGAGPYDDFIQTDASINPGNSGGPLFDLRGQVIGINTAINPQGRGIGFAIPIDALKEVLPQLLRTGHVARGRLGVGIQSMDPTLAKALGLERPTGALVGDVEPGGPAERAGLRSGDVILEVGKETVDDAHELPRVVARHAPGSKVSLKVLRNKSTQTVDVTLDQLKDEAVATEAAPSSAPSGPGGYGLVLGDSRGGGAQVQRVQPGGAADELLMPGDVIVEVNRQPVGNTTEAIKALQSAPKGTVLLKVRREGATQFVAVERK
ncbi:Do family serine endopeptidase [Pendulispora albinea]|uniref:Do family serine endopeptidase n=1 Tax=Pendulispora albinea TaxID=2741071 RepID=A0ABZ2M2F2_9BACT